MLQHMIRMLRVKNAELESKLSKLKSRNAGSNRKFATGRPRKEVAPKKTRSEQTSSASRVTPPGRASAPAEPRSSREVRTDSVGPPVSNLARNVAVLREEVLRGKSSRSFTSRKEDIPGYSESSRTAERYGERK